MSGNPQLELRRRVEWAFQPELFGEEQLRLEKYHTEVEYKIILDFRGSLEVSARSIRFRQQVNNHNILVLMFRGVTIMVDDVTSLAAGIT